MVRWLPIPGYAIAILVYLAGAIAFTLIADASAEDWKLAFGVLALASLAYGWSAGWWAVTLLPLLVLVPLATPFGYPVSRFSEPAPMWMTAVFMILPSAGLILVGVGLRRLWSRLQTRRTRPPRSASAGRTRAV